MPGPRSTASREPVAQESVRVRRLIQDVLGSRFNLTSVQYAGRDPSGKPMFRIRYRPDLGGGARFLGTGRLTNTGALIAKTITFSGGKIGVPFTKPSAFQEGPKAGASDADMQQMRDRWMAWVNGQPAAQMDDNTRASLLKAIQNDNSNPSSLNSWMSRVKVNGPYGYVAEGPGGQDDSWLGDYLAGIGGGGGGGGGGGFAGPEYRAPDRRVIEDMAKGMMVSLIGSVAENRLDAAVNLYMKDDRRNFDSPSAEINPEQSLLAYIREQPEYQEIHALRPEGEDERSWISDRRRAAQAGGLDTGASDEFAIKQATVGGDLKDVPQAAAVSQLQASGQAPQFLDNQFREVATAMFSKVR